MKNLLIVFIFILSVSTAAYAETETDTSVISPASPVTSKTTKSDTYIFAGLTGGIGFSVPTGDLAGNGTQKVTAGYATSFGMIAGYQFMNWAGASFRLDYTTKEINFEKTNVGDKYITSITSQFVEIALGYRGFFSLLYWETGFYFGIPVGYWRQDISNNGSTQSSIVGESGDPLEAQSNYQTGWYLETGVRVPVTDKILLLFGFNLEVPFIEAYIHKNDNDRLQPISGMFNLSILYKI